MTRMIGRLALLGALAAPLPALAGIDVRIRGLGSDEETNCYKQIAILDYALRVDAEKSEYDTSNAEPLRRGGDRHIANARRPCGGYTVEVKSELRMSCSPCLSRRSTSEVSY